MWIKLKNLFNKKDLDNDLDIDLDKNDEDIEYNEIWKNANVYGTMDEEYYEYYDDSDTLLTDLEESFVKEVKTLYEEVEYDPYEDDEIDDDEDDEEDDDDYNNSYNHNSYNNDFYNDDEDEY